MQLYGPQPKFWDSTPRRTDWFDCQLQGNSDSELHCIRVGNLNVLPHTEILVLAEQIGLTLDCDVVCGMYANNEQKHWQTNFSQHTRSSNIDP